MPKGSMYEVNFGYHSKIGRYTTLMSDIPKLSDIWPTPLVAAKGKDTSLCSLDEGGVNTD